MSFLKLPKLPPTNREAVTRAVRRAIEQQAADVAAPSVGPRKLSGRLPSANKLAGGAEKLARRSSEDGEAARTFGAMLEICYLVAAADGLAEEERTALCDLIDYTTRSALKRARLDALFDEMAQLLADQGLEARLDAAAAKLDDFMVREEALSFAALVAIADSVLAPKEAATLIALGKRFDFSVGEVQAVVDVVATTLQRAMVLESMPPPAPEAPAPEG